MPLCITFKKLRYEKFKTNINRNCFTSPCIIRSIWPYRLWIFLYHSTINTALLYCTSYLYFMHDGFFSCTASVQTNIAPGIIMVQIELVTGVCTMQMRTDLRNCRDQMHIAGSWKINLTAENKTLDKVQTGPFLTYWIFFCSSTYDVISNQNDRCISLHMQYS